MEKVQIFHNGERVWSVGHIPNNTFFGPFRGDVQHMVARILKAHEPDPQFQQEKADKTMNIHLETDEQIWLPIVPGALCKWDPTMEMIRGPDDEIYLRTTRDIMPREELRAWFSPSLERELGISKYDIDKKAKGSGHQCRTCEMINQRSALNAHALYNKDDISRSLKNDSNMISLNSTNNPHKNPLHSTLMGLDSCLDHELHSAFKRFASKKFTPFENPKLASLISSFPQPKQLKDASSESLADYHKKEFRKKFQGNEHYLRKHLYREGEERGKCSLARFSEEERNYLTTIAVQRPIKCETFQSSCHGDGDSSCHGDSDVNSRDFCHHVDKRELDVTYNDVNSISRSLEQRHEIWNPFNTYVISKTLSRDQTTDNSTLDPVEGNNDTSSVNDDENLESNSQDIFVHSERTCNDSKTESHQSQENMDKNMEEISLDIATEQNCDERISENRKEVLGLSSDEPERTESKPEHIPTHSSMLCRYYPSATRPWMLTNASFLSAMSMREMTRRAASLSLASFSRYQNVHPLALPYGIPTSTQSQPRVAQGFTCDFCGKVYCRKYVLKIHMRTHTGFKPLKCKFCDKSFSDPSNMKKHVKLHETENTVHKCKHCGRNFVRYRGLLNHIKSKHTEPLTMGILL